MTEREGIMQRLMVVVEDRHVKPRVNSYTTEVMSSGVKGIGEKIMEEAAELVEAAENAGPGGVPAARTHLTYEAADLIYHMFIMLAHCEVKLTDVETELARRFGTSGLDEKAARTKDKSDGGTTREGARQA